MNTHAPGIYAGEGLYEWLRHREAHWANLAIVHRLDKETSGVMVFGKSSVANRSLTSQFATHAINKIYLLATDRPVKRKAFTARSVLVRSGEKYLSRPIHAGGNEAETRFTWVREENGRTFLHAEPITGRTHQIRVHAAEHGFPIIGDSLYGGTPGDRLLLHAQELRLTHPAAGQRMTFSAPPDFTAERSKRLRDAVIDAEQTNAYRLIHGASDKWPGWYVDRLGDFLLSQSDHPLETAQRTQLERWLDETETKGAYHKRLTRHIRQTKVDDASAERLLGQQAPGSFAVRENGLQFELSFREGYSTGLFLDQRDNRRRLLKNHIGADFPFADNPSKNREVLNTFAYTCSFSVCAAKAGAHTTSLDLSKKYLEWGKRNFLLNGLDPGRHDFIYGDAFDWLRRMAKKDRTFDTVILDPPTFSQSKDSGAFRAEKDYGSLAALALPLLKPNGILFVSTNAAKWPPEEFVRSVESVVAKARRKVMHKHYAPQPPDFQMSKQEPGYLKTLWLQIE